jgi:hypothetical protein
MNIINAIINLVNNPRQELISHHQGHNRANNAGDALEEYVKDLFANTFGMNENERLEKLSSVFSYLGNNSNPPDAMLRSGDAIEVKKIENNDSALALNSSYPKHTLRSSSPMISKACKQAESWTEKDIIYVVGVVDKKTNNLRHLCMVYGLDYCASDECYSKIKFKIKAGVESIPGVEFTESKELGHINRVDPLGITYMRVRGMWGIENPWKVFRYVYQRDLSKDFNFMCIINSSKWNTFTNRAELIQLAENISSLSITDVRIKNPDNPAQLNDAKLISFSL